MGQGVYTGKDRRTSIRFPFKAEVTVEHEGETFEARGINFNDDAISIVHDSSVNLELGTVLMLAVVDELGNRVVLRGEVARLEVGQGGTVTAVVRRLEAAPG